VEARQLLELPMTAASRTKKSPLWAGGRGSCGNSMLTTMPMSQAMDGRWCAWNRIGWTGCSPSAANGAGAIRSARVAERCSGVMDRLRVIAPTACGLGCTCISTLQAHQHANQIASWDRLVEVQVNQKSAGQPRTPLCRKIAGPLGILTPAQRTGAFWR
jgi:hypothetical protein